MKETQCLPAERKPQRWDKQLLSVVRAWCRAATNRSVRKKGRYTGRSRWEQDKAPAAVYPLASYFTQSMLQADIATYITKRRLFFFTCVFLLFYMVWLHVCSSLYCFYMSHWCCFSGVICFSFIVHTHLNFQGACFSFLKVVSVESELRVLCILFVRTQSLFLI